MCISQTYAESSVRFLVGLAHITNASQVNISPAICASIFYPVLFLWDSWIAVISCKWQVVPRDTERIREKRYCCKREGEVKSSEITVYCFKYVFNQCIVYIVLQGLFLLCHLLSLTRGARQRQLTTRGRQHFTWLQRKAWLRCAGYCWRVPDSTFYTWKTTLASHL